jgi:hypothetical protein
VIEDIFDHFETANDLQDNFEGEATGEDEDSNSLYVIQVSTCCQYVDKYITGLYCIKKQ